MKMDGRLLAVTVLLFNAHLLLARTMSVSRAVESSTTEEWIVYLKLNKEYVCAAVEVGNEWILTLGDCVKTGKLAKYEVVFQDGEKRKIRAEERSPVKGFLVLLQTEVDSETDKDFTDLADTAVPNNYDFTVYNWNKNDVLKEDNVEFVPKRYCRNKGIEGYFNKELHMCFKASFSKNTQCLPGFPVFGTKNSKVVLQSLSTTGLDGAAICSEKYQAAVTIDKHKSWIELFLTDCGAPPSIDNGMAKLDDKFYTTYGETATVTCYKGHRSSRRTLTCQASGAWKTTKCKAKDCGLPPAIPGVTVNLTSESTTYGSSANVSCNPGYDSNHTEIVCQLDGMWETPTCTIKDCGLPPAILGVTVNLTSESTTYGSSANVSCNPGYDSNQTEIACLPNGMWEIPACAIKDCGSVPTVSSGTVTLDSAESTYGSTATLKCDPGYDDKQTTIACQASGSWERRKCTIRDCGAHPVIIANGTVTLNSVNTTVGSTANVTCEDCGSVLPIVANGNYTLDDPSSTIEYSTATLTCFQGFESDRVTFFCTPEGTWETPKCRAIDR